MTGYLFRNCRIFDGISRELREGASVLVRGNRIERLAGTELAADGVQTIDIRGRVLMPGMIDAHVHVTCAGLNLPELTRRPASYVAAYATMFLGNTLRRGFCTVRDAAGADFGLAHAVDDGLIAGPRLLFSGKAISQTGGHGDFRTPPHLEACACNYNGELAVLADGADEVRKAAREELRKGAHQVKIFVSGGIVSPSDPFWMPQMTDAEIIAAVEEAATRKTYVMAHAHTAAAITRAARLGVRTIEHATQIDEAAAQAVLEAGAYVVPTLALFHALHEYGKDSGFPQVSQDKVQYAYDHAMQGLEVCRKWNIPMGFGTDLIGELERHQCIEFELRSQVLSPFEILRSATSVGAEVIGRVGELGVIAEGALADILVVDGDPLQDLSVFAPDGAHLDLIMKDGVIYKNRLSAGKDTKARRKGEA